MKPPSIVCDPTLAVDALLRPQGPSGRLLRRFLDRRDFELVLTEPLLDQIRRATTDSKVLERANLGIEEVERWVAALGVLATVIESNGEVAEAGDDPTLQTAAAVGDAVIVALDPEVLAQPADVLFEAVRPEVLLEVLEARDAAGLSAEKAG